MHIHFIQHESFEAPGAFLQWAEDRKYQVSFSKVYENQTLPDAINDIDMLIVLGGPQDPHTSKEDCPYFDSRAEVSFIKQCIDAKKATVGICLGSQLIGVAMGANFEHSPQKEIGVFPIQLTADGLTDPLISHFGKTLNVGHWHNDMPGLTSNCKVLATSEGCPRQIVRYSSLVYGFQCHLELTTQVVKLLMVSDAEVLSHHADYRFVQSTNEILSENYDEMNAKLSTFLDKLTDLYLLSK